MARTPSGSVCMHRPCAGTAPVRVRGDPTHDPTPALDKPGAKGGLGPPSLLRWAEDRGFGLTWRKPFVGRESPPEGLSPLVGPLDWDEEGVAMVAGEVARTITPLRLLERESELAALEAILAAARLG